MTTQARRRVIPNPFEQPGFKTPGVSMETAKVRMKNKLARRQNSSCDSRETGNQLAE